MDELPEPLPFPALTTAAMLGAVSAGLGTAACGLQLLVFLQLPNAVAWAPAALIGLGIAGLLVGAQTSDAAARPTMLAAGLTGLSFLALSTVSICVMLIGVFSPLFLATPPFVLGAFVLIVVQLPASTRYTRAQDAFRVALAKQPAGDFPNPFSAAAPSTSPWVRFAAVALPTLLLGWIPLAMWAPVAFNRLSLQAQLLASASWPSSAASLGPAARSAFPYRESPLTAYLAYERRFLDFDDAAIAAFADRIAEDVGWQMLLATGAGTIAEAERALWADGNGKAVPLWIADALRSRGVFYHRESLLSRSFDPWRHTGEAEVHMDCDQLVHLFAHVAWRLDLPMYEIQSPLHQYLQYRPPEGLEAEPLYVETTSFRRVDVTGGRVDYMGASIGEDFLIPFDYHSSGQSGIRASRDIVEAAGLYQPSTQRDIDDSIVANVLAGVADEEGAPVRAELEAHLDGTRSYLLVSNLYAELTHAATDALATDPASALRDAREAEGLRADFPHLLLTTEPLERILAGRALVASGGDAKPEVATIRAWYEANANFGDPPQAFSATSVDALLLFAAVDGANDHDACDRTYGAVLRFGSRFDSVPWTDRLCAGLAASPACSALARAAACPT